MPSHANSCLVLEVGWAVRQIAVSKEVVTQEVDTVEKPSTKKLMNQNCCHSETFSLNEGKHIDVMTDNNTCLQLCSCFRQHFKKLFGRLGYELRLKR